LFKAGGHIKKYEWDSFQEPSWITMFLGFGILPDSYHPIVDTLDIKELELSLRKMKQSLIHVTDEAPSHAEFINTYVVSNDLR
jgi:tryptophan halogenase